MVSNATIKAQARIDRQLKNVEDLNHEISLLNEEELIELENRARSEIRCVKRRLDLVKVIGGKPISKKAFESVRTHEEFVKSQEKNLMEFTAKSDMVYDTKTGKPIEKITYKDEGTSYWRELSNIPEEYESITLTFDRLDVREHNGKQHLKYLQSITEAINKRRKEERIAVLEVKEKEGKLKEVRISELGRLLMKSNPIQKIPPKK
jgi:hypothetical protein